jgi:hypothetical protein
MEAGGDAVGELAVGSWQWLLLFEGAAAVVGRRQEIVMFWQMLDVDSALKSIHHTVLIWCNEVCRDAAGAQPLMHNTCPSQGHMGGGGAEK